MASTKQTLDELLSDFSQRLDDLYENNDEVFQSMVMSEFIKSLDSLALGKPEPLAKNKQTQEYCECKKPAIWKLDDGSKGCVKCNYMLKD